MVVQGSCGGPCGRVGLLFPVGGVLLLVVAAGAGWFRVELLGLLGRVGDEPVPVAEAAAIPGDQPLDDLQQLMLRR